MVFSIRNSLEKGSSIDDTMVSWSHQLGRLGLIILRLDPVIMKGRIVLNVDVSGLDPIIPK